MLKNIPNRWKWVLRSLPLAGVVGASFLPIQRFGQQVSVLIVLIWLQVFLLFECFLAGK